MALTFGGYRVSSTLQTGQVFPENAFDGDPATYWGSDSFTSDAAGGNQPFFSVKLAPYSRVGFVHVLNLPQQFSSFHAFIASSGD